MSAITMDGRELSRRLRPELERYAREIKQRQHRAPALAAVLVGDDPASRQYVRNKRRFAEELGFESRMLTMTAEEASTDRTRSTVTGCSTRSIPPRTSTRWVRST